MRIKRLTPNSPSIWKDSTRNLLKQKAGYSKPPSHALFYYNRFIWLLIVYMLGAYIRLYPPVKYVNSLKWLFVSAFIFFFMECAIYVLERFQPFFNKIGIVDGIKAAAKDLRRR